MSSPTVSAASTLTSRVLSFWFAGYTNFTLPVPQQALGLWFRGGKEMDEKIEHFFGKDLAAAAAGDPEYTALASPSPTATPESSTAYVILLDQFSRNVWRGTTRSFAQDEAALAASRSLIATSPEGVAALDPVHHAFLIMPFMHGECLSVQEESVRRFEELASATKARSEPSAHPSVVSMLESFSTYAKKHRDDLVRFGRYPHRNEILGRESTEEEKEYLKAGGGF